MAAPRIALLVHNRLENDPRVSRHGYAARRAGYRVAVLSVGAQHAGQARWGEAVDGIVVFESRVIRVSLLGKLRRYVSKRSARKAPTQSAVLASTNGAAHGVRRSVGIARAVQDVATIFMLLRNNIGAFRQFRGIGANLVHANDLNVLFAGFLLARVWKAPLVYDSHELWTQLDEDWSPMLRWLFGLLEGPLLRSADAVVTVNTLIAHELARAYRAPLPIVVMNCPEVPAGEHSEQHPVPSDGGATAEVRLDHIQRGSQPLRVIYQGMLNYKGRGLEGLIDAVSGLDGVELTLRGPGDLAGPLQQRITKLGASNVRIVPPVPMANLVQALHGYDVGVISYLPAGMNFQYCSPNKLFEYMMAGLAVVCSDLPVLREVVMSSECGLLYEPGNAESLAAALHELVANPYALVTYKGNAWRTARERYNAAEEEGKLLDLYERLLAGTMP